MRLQIKISYVPPLRTTCMLYVVSVNIQQIIGDETDGMVLTHPCVETRCFPDVL